MEWLEWGSLNAFAFGLTLLINYSCTCTNRLGSRIGILSFFLFLFLSLSFPFPFFLFLFLSLFSFLFVFFLLFFDVSSFYVIYVD